MKKLFNIVLVFALVVAAFFAGNYISKENESDSDKLPVVLTNQGRVVKVADGDSFTLLTDDKNEISIRLYGIDCPEQGQPFSNKAKEFTSGLIYDKVVTIDKQDIDRYGRTVAIVSLPDGRILNEELLKAGLAWHYTRYDNNADWQEMEDVAKAKKLNIWRDDNPIQPEKYRRQKYEGS